MKIGIKSDIISIRSFIAKAGIDLAVSYNKLWKLLIDRKVSIPELRKAANIAPNTMTKLRRDENVNLAILGRICCVLHCDYGDIMTYVSESSLSEESDKQLDFREIQSDI